MFSIEPNGLLLGANDRWFEMTGHPRDRVYEMSFMETIAESSRQAMEMGWRRLTIDGMPWSGELQMKQKWYDPATGEEHDNWMLAAAQPEYSAGGTVKIIMGSLTDITAQKRSAKDAEARARLSEELLNLQKERLEEAEETRRQQNNFIDMTSQ
jgi:PAS domain S-box-containing protein